MEVRRRCDQRPIEAVGSEAYSSLHYRARLPRSASPVEAPIAAPLDPLNFSPLLPQGALKNRGSIGKMRDHVDAAASCSFQVKHVSEVVLVAYHSRHRQSAAL